MSMKQDIETAIATVTARYPDAKMFVIPPSVSEPAVFGVDEGGTNSSKVIGYLCGTPGETWVRAAEFCRALPASQPEVVTERLEPVSPEGVQTGRQETIYVKCMCGEDIYLGVSGKWYHRQGFSSRCSSDYRPQAMPAAPEVRPDPVSTSVQTAPTKIERPGATAALLRVIRSLKEDLRSYRDREEALEARISELEAEITRLRGER